MNAKDTIATWKWRIVKANISAKAFSESLGIQPQQFSLYITGKQNPSIERFDMIEGKLKDLGV